MHHFPLHHEPFPHRAWAVIDLDALRHNYTVLSQGVSDIAPCTSVAVVKANAYGHGAETVVRTLWAEGCRHFAVATIDEAVQVWEILKDLGHAALLLVLGYVPPEAVTVAAHCGITLTCVSADHAEALNRSAVAAGVKISCHVALDTGMNRIGLPAQTSEEQQATLKSILHIMSLEGLEVTGMFTHFAVADEAYDDAVSAQGRTMRQYQRYRAIYDGLVTQGRRPAFCHICNSAAAIRMPPLRPDFCFDGVRFGISLYGYGVSPAPHHRYALRPVMKLCTRVVHLHTLHPGEVVSYGGRFTADSPRTIATLSIGYADGFRRGFEGGTVTFHTAEGDVTAPLVGRICMDQCMADVTGLPVAVGDQVTLFGATAPGFSAPQLTLEALSLRAGTIPYEALCLVTARVPRIIQS